MTHVKEAIKCEECGGEIVASVEDDGIPDVACIDKEESIENSTEEGSGEITYVEDAEEYTAVLNVISSSPAGSGGTMKRSMSLSCCSFDSMNFCNSATLDFKSFCSDS